MGMHDKSKFVFSETFNNSNGKTSGSGFIGVMLGLIGGLCFIAAIVGWFLEIPDALEVMGKIILLVTIAGGLLGLRKLAGNGKNGETTSPPLFQENPNVDKG